MKNLISVSTLMLAMACGLASASGSPPSAETPEISAETMAASITPAQRARIAAKAEKVRRAAAHGPAGFPDLAQILYVNSRTGPIITRGPDRSDVVRTLSPSMYFDGMRQISRMTRYDSARGVYSPSDEARGQVSADPFRVAPRNALGSWTSIGPANQGGRTRGLLIDPGNPNRMYAAGVAGGIWRSTDAGANWTTNTDQLENLAVVSLAFDPANSNIIYAGTGEGFFNFDAVRGAGVFRSLDAGNTWTQLAATNNSNFHYAMAIQVSPVASQRVWVATRTGVFRSNDGGASFTAVGGIIVGNGCSDMAMQRFAGPPVTANVFVSCGMFGQGRIYRIADEAASSAVEVLADVGQSRSSIAVAPSDPNTVYVMSSRSGGTTGAGVEGLRGIYRSTTGGGPGSFVLRRDGTVNPANETERIQISQLSNPVFALASCVGTAQIFNQGWYDNVIAVDPVDPNIVWAGGIDLFRSNDGGANWGVASYWWFDRTNPNYAHADQHAITFHPQYDGVTNRTMYVGNDGGVQRTLNARANVGSTAAAVCGTPVAGAVTWEDRSNGYVTTQFYDGVAYPDGLTYFGGMQDNGTMRGSSASQSWSTLAGGDGSYNAVNTLGDATPGNDVLFHGFTGNSMQRSTNGGASFISVAVPGNPQGFEFIAPFTMDEGNRQRLWTGGWQIFRTINQATNWTQMTGGGGTCGNGSISAIAVHPTDGNRVLIGMSDGCYHVRTDALGAASAGLWPGGTNILAGSFISWMAWDPSNINVAYATVSRFGVNNVFKTTNAGTSWSPSVGSGAGALPQIPVLSVAVNPNNGNQVFVGTDLGVFTSNDGGASWVVENTGFARTPVEALKFNQAGTRLFAFTHGRGAWRTEICTTCRSIGGTVSGLSANSVQLRLNGGPALTVSANGNFAFPDTIATGDAYAVTVSLQPSSPALICTVSNGTGTVPAANVTNVQVSCAVPSYTIGGTISGLAAGNDVVLRNNGGNNLTVNANGSFTFSTPITDGGAYAVTVFTQPTTPNQTCVVTNGSGTVAGANVTNVSVACTTTTYTIGGTLSGLAAGATVVLRNNGGNDLVASGNGGFAFGIPLADGSPYAVTVFTQPTTPNQTCVVTNGSGTVAGANVTNVSVVCTTTTYTIGGTISGLATGNDVVLRNNGGNNLTVAANGSFTFSTPIIDGGAYAVTVLTQPTTPNQTCVVTNGSGTVAGANVTAVSVACTTTTYTIGGTISGLATGNDVVLRNNGGNNLTVAANGSFSFSTPITDVGSYAVTVFTQPTTPNQTCVVTNGSGTVAGANVTNVSVACTTTTYTIGGTVSGLATGNDVVLRNSGGNDLTVNANGSFSFSTPITDGGTYAVTVFTQPTTPNQICVVTNGSGTVAGANVTAVSVACTTTTYTIGGTISGLATGNDVVLRNSGGNDLTVNANGSFSFSTPVSDGGSYAVTVFTQPTTPNQTCVVTNGSGTVAGANVNNVSVACTTATYTIGGTLSGLAAGATVVLRNNGGNDLALNANGVFTFSTPVTDGDAYVVTVFTQPSTANQVCRVDNGSGTVAGSNVTSVAIACVGNLIFNDGFEPPTR